MDTLPIKLQHIWSFCELYMGDEGQTHKGSIIETFPKLVAVIP